MTSDNGSATAAPPTRARLIWLAIVVATLAAALLLPAGAWRYLPAFLLLWVLPGLAWRRRLPQGDLVSELGLGLLLTTLLALLLVLIPGPLSRGALLGGTAMLAVLPRLIRPASSRVHVTGARWPLIAAFAALLVLAAFLRFSLLGYKEFQGDEGIVLQRAAAIILGEDAQLFRHQKGPVEILISLATWRLNGLLNETTARLPFTFAGLLAIPALVLTGRHWLPTGVALVAGLFLALNGFATGFARIVQYQSLVLLWGTLSLYHAQAYRESRQPGNLVLAAAFLAGGLLAHYDAVLFAPAVGWLVLPTVVTRAQRDWSAWAAALLAGLLISGSFYLPYLLSPAFAGTSRYLVQNRIGGTLLSWSGGRVWQMATLYNDTYTVIALLLLGAAGIWQMKNQPALLLVFAVPALFYTVVVVDPRTHIYTLGPGLALLAAAGLFALWKRWKWLAMFALTLIAASSTVYLTLLFVDPTPERQRTWEMNAPRFYVTTWDEPPQYGLFGFPHQAGWRLAGRLVDDFPYASNEEEEVTGWYMAQAPRTYCPDRATFLDAERTQDALPVGEEMRAGLHVQKRIVVNGEPSLTIYGPSPAPETPTLEATGTVLWRAPEEVVPRVPQPAQPLDVIFGDKVRLLGFDLDADEAHPGGSLAVTLYWEALVPFERNFQVFVHLYDGEMRAQDDGAPRCDMHPTTHWEQGEIVADPRRVALPIDIPAGTYPLLAGMYDLLDSTRLPIAGTADNAWHLASVTIRDEAN